MEIKQFLIEEGEAPKSYNAIAKFLQIKSGDIVAIKNQARQEVQRQVLLSMPMPLLLKEWALYTLTIRLN